MKKLLLLTLIVLTVYSAYQVIIPKKESDKIINEIIIPKGQKSKYQDIIKKVKSRNSKYNTKNKKDIETAYTPRIKIKIKDKYSDSSKLFISAYLYNNTNKTINEKIFIKCDGLDSSNKKVDSFSWSGNLKLKSKKTYLVNDINMGYINAYNIKKISCSVDN